MKSFFAHLEEYIGGMLFIVMLLVLILQIFSRQLLDIPMKWSEELARFLFVYIGYFGVSSAIKENQHVYIDFFVKKLPEKVQWIIHWVLQVLILLILAMMCYIGVMMTIRKIPVPIVSLSISYAYMYGALPVLSLLMIYRHIERQVIEFKQRRQAS